MAKKSESEVSGKLTKAKMMRDAFATLGLDAPLEDIQKFVKSKYDVELTKAHISQTKTSERKKKGIKGKKGRAKKSENTSPDIDVTGTLDLKDVFALFADIQRYKDKLGAKNVKKVVEEALA